jgi:hypothetical protein
MARELPWKGKLKCTVGSKKGRAFEEIFGVLKLD